MNIIPGTIYKEKCDSYTGEGNWYKYIFVLGESRGLLHYVTIAHDWAYGVRKQRKELDYSRLLPSSITTALFWDYISSGILEPVTDKPPFSITEIEKGFKCLKTAIHQTHMMFKGIARYGLAKPELDKIEIGRKVK